MVWDVAVHRADHTYIVDAATQLGENIADLDTTLTILLETERRSHQIANLHDNAAAADRFGSWHRLAVVLVEHWLGIEGIDLRWAAVEEQKDYALHFGCKVRSGGASGG